MAFTTTIEQFMRLAIEAEKMGEDYYRTLAAHARDKAIRNICWFMASEERDHQRTFKRILRDSKNRRREYTFDFDILKIMEQGNRNLFDSKAMVKKLEDPAFNVLQCLGIALHAEKEAIRIYRSIQAALDKGYEATIHQIICEENDHADIIQKVINALTGKNAPAPAQAGQVTTGIDGTVAISAIEKKVLVKKTVIRRKAMFDNFRDYFYILMMALVLVAIVVAMMGPRLIEKLLQAL